MPTLVSVESESSSPDSGSPFSLKLDPIIENGRSSMKGNSGRGLRIREKEMGGKELGNL